MFSSSAGDGSFISGLPRSRAEAPGMLGDLLWTHGASDTEVIQSLGALLGFCKVLYAQQDELSHKRGRWGEIESLAFKQLKL